MKKGKGIKTENVIMSLHNRMLNVLHTALVSLSSKKQISS